MDHYTRAVQPVRNHFEDVNVGLGVIKTRCVDKMDIEAWELWEGNLENGYFVCDSKPCPTIP